MDTYEQSLARDEAVERSRERTERRLENNGEFRDVDPWPEIPVLKPITVRPVQVTAPEFVGTCPECDGPNTRFHRCPARD